MFRHTRGLPASSCFIIIPPSVGSSDFQLLYPFIHCLGGGFLSEIPVYRLLFIYYHILPYQFLLPIPYSFIYLMKYHSKCFNGYLITLFILEHGSIVDSLPSQGYHQQYYPFSNLYPRIHGRRYWG